MVPKDLLWKNILGELAGDVLSYVFPEQAVRKGMALPDICELIDLPASEVPKIIDGVDTD